MHDSWFHLSTQNYSLVKTQCCCISEDRRGQGNAEMQKCWLMEQSVRTHISVSQVYHSNIGPICDVTNFHNNIKDIMSDIIPIMKIFTMFQQLPKHDKNICQHLLFKLWHHKTYLRQGYCKFQFLFLGGWFQSVYAKHTKQK